MVLVCGDSNLGHHIYTLVSTRPLVQRGERPSWKSVWRGETPWQLKKAWDCQIIIYIQSQLNTPSPSGPQAAYRDNYTIPGIETPGGHFVRIVLFKLSKGPAGSHHDLGMVWRVPPRPQYSEERDRAGNPSGDWGPLTMKKAWDCQIIIYTFSRNSLLLVHQDTGRLSR